MFLFFGGRGFALFLAGRTGWSPFRRSARPRSGWPSACLQRGLLRPRFRACPCTCPSPRPPPGVPQQQQQQPSSATTSRTFFFARATKSCLKTWKRPATREPRRSASASPFPNSSQTAPKRMESDLHLHLHLLLHLLQRAREQSLKTTMTNGNKLKRTLCTKTCSFHFLNA